MNGNVKEGKWKIGIAFLLAVLVPVPMVGAQAGIEGLKGIDLFMLIGYEGMNAFTMLSRITLALSFLVAITGFAYFIHKRRKKEAKGWKGREEEIMEIIKEVKELKKRMEEKGVEFVFGLSVVVALCLAMVSMLK